jgi:uncharacterized Zn-binding protein involved in type VI secretion
LALPIAVGFAQTPAPPANPVAGSPDTLINGKPTQRAGDQTGATMPLDAPPAAPETSPNVMINGKPAVIGCAKK